MPEKQPEKRQEEELLLDYVINKVIQTGIRATSHEEALKAVMDGGGDIIATNFSVQFRPQPVSGAPPMPPQATRQLKRA